MSYFLGKKKTFFSHRTYKVALLVALAIRFSSNVSFRVAISSGQEPQENIGSLLR